ncbi:methyltransferase domain-containing protein [Ekhidna sp.]|uniref:methyltransferase domain-containing protein n=1 Tax=Ekhidna sp. TaxID=2608089 RepID=UPI003C7A042D
MAVNDFDSVAPFYDRISKLFFGGLLTIAQGYYLKEIGANDRVLILGGGTGKILKHVPNSEELDFVEKSQRMLDRAKKRRINRSVNYIQADFLEFESEKKYDVIICPFFLDCFGEQSLNTVIVKVKELLCTNGTLIVTDFDRKRIHPFLLESMLIFFDWFSNLEATQLIDLRSFLKKNGFEENGIKFYEKGVFSALYSPVSKMKQ